MRINLRISNIISILVLHVGVISLSYVHFDIYNKIIYLFNFIIGVFLLNKFKIFFKKKYFKINLCVLLYCILIIISSLYNYKIENTVLKGILYSIGILEIFLYFEYLDYIDRVHNAIDIFYYISLVYVIINDILMFMLPVFFSLRDNYLLGNKFSVCYLHLFVIIFYCAKNKKNNKLILLVYTVVFFCISIVTQCSTAIIAGIIMIVLLIIPKNIRVRLYNPKTILIIAAISSTFFIFISMILSNKFVQYFVVNILKEDITLTGRTRIYENIMNIIYQSPWFGFGYGNSHELLMKMIQAPNSQNGFLECIITSGIFSTMLLIVIIYKIFKSINKRAINSNTYFILGAVYIFIVLASIEITINTSFIFLLAILNVSTYIEDRNIKESRSNA